MRIHYNLGNQCKNKEEIILLKFLKLEVNFGLDFGKNEENKSEILNVDLGKRTINIRC